MGFLFDSIGFLWDSVGFLWDLMGFYVGIWWIPKNGATQKWMVCTGKSIYKWMIWGYPFMEAPRISGILGG